MKNKALLILVVLLSCFMFSCNRQKEEVILFDNTYPQALSPNVSWALVTDPYAAYKKEVGWNSDTNGHCRRGEILMVIGQSMDNENTKWYRFEEGWLPGTCLTIYSNRYKAQNAASQLID